MLRLISGHFASNHLLQTSPIIGLLRVAPLFFLPPGLPLRRLNQQHGLCVRLCLRLIALRISARFAGNLLKRFPESVVDGGLDDVTRGVRQSPQTGKGFELGYQLVDGISHASAPDAGIPVAAVAALASMAAVSVPRSYLAPFVALSVVRPV